MAFEPPTEYNSAIMVNKSFQIVSPTVAELTEANPILAYNSNLAQTAATTATTQANAAATSAQTAQQAAAQATEISDPEGWRTNTRAMITDLGNSKSNIGVFNFGSAGGCLQTTGNPMYGVLDQSHCMTLELDEDFKSSTHQYMSLNFTGDNQYNSGYYGIGLILSGDGRLMLRVGNGSRNGGYFYNSPYLNNIFGGIDPQTIPAGKYTFCLCIHFDATDSNASTARIYVNGAMKWDFAQAMAIGDNYESSPLQTSTIAWTENSKLGFFDTTNYHTTNQFSTYGCFIGKASRFAVFNFDMSASDAPYTVADYYNGKAISPAMQSSLNITWNATDVPIYSMRVGSFFEITAGSVGFFNAPATIAYEDDGSISWTTKSATSGRTYILAYRFKKAAFGSGKVKVNIGALTSTLPSDAKFYINYFNASGTASDSTRQEISTNGGSFEFNYKDGCMGIGIQIDTKTKWAVGNSLKVASVSVVVDGCIVASSDYAIARNSTTKLVKDITGNGNDLTVYGDVVGDKDAAVAAFVDELKTQISQNS